MIAVCIKLADCSFLFFNWSIEVNKCLRHSHSWPSKLILSVIDCRINIRDFDTKNDIKMDYHLTILLPKTGF